MANRPVHLVWFKRDARVEDHAPLAEACAQAHRDQGMVCPLLIVEPALWSQGDLAARHGQALASAFGPLDDALQARGGRLVVRIGAAVEVLESLRQTHAILALWSHQETGTLWTYDRDRAVAGWAQEHGIAWYQIPQHGVIRGLKDRTGWAGRWDCFMAQARYPAPGRLPGGEQVVGAIDPGPRPGEAFARVGGPGPAALLTPPVTPAGAWAALTSFLDQRGARYHKEMSAPASAYRSCSRLSVHLAWGTISMRDVAQAAWARRHAWAQQAKAQRGSWLPALDAFIGRLHWHCHFMQKLEDFPTLEREELHPAYAGLRPSPTGDAETAARFEAWARGQTGWPFVDACMRALAAHGWINFRMRAMLQAVASYHLWIDWRASAQHLANLFIDYEPGIHYAQAQMQSGTTGINSLRIYNPVKQGQDHDPAGTFIRQWVPELAGVPAPAIHTPWRLSALDQEAAGMRLGVTYPVPRVDHQAAAREAKQRLGALRRAPDHREAAQAVQQRHGSRKSGIPRRGDRQQRRRAESAQRHGGQGRFEGL